MRFLPHQERVVDERTALDHNIQKLGTFIQSEQYAALGDEERHWLKEQLMVMGVYSDILSRRIDLFVPATNTEAAALLVEPTTEMSQSIADMDQFAMLVDQWHATTFADGQKLLTIPEGTTVTVEDQKTGQAIEMDLNGPYLEVFRTGAMAALELFRNLPFGVSVEDNPEEPNHADG